MKDPMRSFAALVLVLATAACGDDRGPSAVTLPPATAASGIVTGDLAGVAQEIDPYVRNPYQVDQAAIRQGERLYNQMNCVDCHGYDGQGGMCPSLIDGEWLFGDTPADKFVSIHRGRARGMPAYGRMLPDESIWKIVAYLDELHASGGRAGAGRRAGGEPASSTRQQTQGGRH